MNKRLIVLVGFMCSGKTTAAQRVAGMLSLSWSDLDNLICLHEQKSIDEIFRSHGEAYFRRIETEQLQTQIRLSSDSWHILAGGGGLAARAENREMLKRHCISVFLDTDYQKILERINVRDSYTARPLLDGLDFVQIRELYQERCGLYRQVADFIVKNDKQLLELLRELMNNEAVKNDGK
jgi:shikimate kinase